MFKSKWITRLYIPVDDLISLLAAKDSDLDYQLFKQTDQLDSVLRKVTASTISAVMYRSFVVFCRTSSHLTKTSQASHKLKTSRSQAKYQHPLLLKKHSPLYQRNQLLLAHQTPLAPWFNQLIFLQVVRAMSHTPIQKLFSLIWYKILPTHLLYLLIVTLVQ